MYIMLNCIYGSILHGAFRTLVSSLLDKIHLRLQTITEDLWTRDALSPRDRSMVTVSMLIARNQPGDLKHYIDITLDNGVTPAALSEIITHLAFYSGWPNAMSAVSVTKAVAVFETRGVTADAFSGPASSQSGSRKAAFRDSGKMLAQYLQAWLNSLQIHCSWISGKDPR